MIDGRSVSRTLFRWVIILVIGTVTATALLGGVGILNSDEPPGSDFPPGKFISSGEVTTSDGSLYLDRAGQPTVVGEIDNDNGSTITDVTVSVTIYENGAEVATRETSPLTATIPDGTTAPYEVRFATDVEPDEYTAEVSYVSGAESGGKIELVDAQEDSVAQDSVTVSGSVTNVDDTTVEHPMAIVTFYDENGKVIGARTDRLLPLEPGATGEFTVRYSTLGDVPSLAREYADYSAIVVDKDD